MAPREFYQISYDEGVDAFLLTTFVDRSESALHILRSGKDALLAFQESFPSKAVIPIYSEEARVGLNGLRRFQ